MAYNFNGKVAIVTGSSNGIGRETAKMMAACGAFVCIHGRDPNTLKVTNELCLEVNGNNSNKILEVLGDLTDETVAKRLVEETVAKFGQIDVLVNNAGGSNTQFKPDEIEGSLKIFDYVTKLNVRSILQLCQIALPHLEKTKGSVVNVSSIAGLNFASPHFPYYGISKAAQDQLTRNLAAHFIQKGVRVNGVNPGLISTNIVQSLGVPDEVVKKMESGISSEPRRVPIGRPGTPGEIAHAILFLADNEKSSYIVGDLLRIDGGSSLHNPFLAEGYNAFSGL